MTPMKLLALALTAALGVGVTACAKKEATAAVPGAEASAGEAPAAAAMPAAPAAEKAPEAAGKVEVAAAGTNFDPRAEGADPGRCLLLRHGHRPLRAHGQGRRDLPALQDEAALHGRRGSEGRRRRSARTDRPRGT